MKEFIHARAGGAGGGSKPAAPSPAFPPPPSTFGVGQVGAPPQMPTGQMPVSSGSAIWIVLAMLLLTAAMFGGAIYVALRVVKEVGKAVEREQNKKNDSGDGKSP